MWMNPEHKMLKPLHIQTMLKFNHYENSVTFLFFRLLNYIKLMKLKYVKANFQIINLLQYAILKKKINIILPKPPYI